jgi:hypothetical protein
MKIVSEKRYYGRTNYTSMALPVWLGVLNVPLPFHFQKF